MALPVHKASRAQPVCKEIKAQQGIWGRMVRSVHVDRPAHPELRDRRVHRVHRVRPVYRELQVPVVWQDRWGHKELPVLRAKLVWMAKMALKAFQEHVAQQVLSGLPEAWGRQVQQAKMAPWDRLEV
jgi:hypothetical protein